MAHTSGHGGDGTGQRRRFRRHRRTDARCVADFGHRHDRGRPQRNAERLQVGPQPAVEQNDGKGQIGDEKRQRHVVEIDLARAVLARQHAHYQKDQQQQQGEKGDEKKEQQEAQKGKKQDQISKEDAQRILNALMNQEKHLILSLYYMCVQLNHQNNLK